MSRLRKQAANNGLEITKQQVLHIFNNNEEFEIEVTIHNSSMLIYNYNNDNGLGWDLLPGSEELENGDDYYEFEDVIADANKIVLLKLK